MRGSDLGIADEQAAEEASRSVSAEATVHHQPGPSSAPSSESRDPQPLDPVEGEAIEAPRVGGRGPDVAPRTRRTWTESNTQTPVPSDWSSFDVQASLRGLRFADEAGKRRICAGGMPAVTRWCACSRLQAQAPRFLNSSSCRMVIGFTIELEGDLMFYRHQSNMRIVLVLVDRGVRWTSTVVVPDKSTPTLLQAFDTSWVAIFGPPQVLIFDGEAGLNDEEATTYFQLRGITKRTAAPNQHTRVADRKIAVLRDTLHKMSAKLSEEGLQVPFERMCADATFALNSLTSVNGCSPYAAVLGRVAALLPGDDSVTDDGVPDAMSRHTHRLREVAVQAIAEGTAQERIKRAIRTQTRPSGAQHEFKLGDRVDYWREPVHKEASGWRGPAVIADLSRLEHGRVGIRTNTDLVLTRRLQDVRRSLTYLTEELAVFFGAPELMAASGTQASHAQQVVQQFVDDLGQGAVIILGS